MNDVIISVIVTLLSGAVGALIGTYFGSYFIVKKAESKKEEIRQIAIKAIDVIKKYAHDGKTYDVVFTEFNNAISIAEKRTVIVALHKLGIPIVVHPSSAFKIENIVFDNKVINKEELEAIVKQIEQGYCDHLFYLDPEKYFDDNVRLQTVRSIAKRWVHDVYTKSIYDRETKMVVYPQNWFESFSYGEQLAIGVFRARVSTFFYFTIKNDADVEKMTQLEREIELGLWDSCFYWEIENYENMTANTSINNKMTQMMQNMMNQGQT